MEIYKYKYFQKKNKVIIKFKMLKMIILMNL